MTDYLTNEEYQNGFKRTVDIVGALFLLILFFPLAILISLLIKINSKGPIFADVPERIGEKGKKFRMYKFRSMVNNAHFLLRTDPRFNKLFEE